MWDGKGRKQYCGLLDRASWQRALGYPQLLSKRCHIWKGWCEEAYDASLSQQASLRFGDARIRADLRAYNYG